jgi:hypothetical protein
MLAPIIRWPSPSSTAAAACVTRTVGLAAGSLEVAVAADSDSGSGSERSAPGPARAWTRREFRVKPESRLPGSGRGPPRKRLTRSALELA